MAAEGRRPQPLDTGSAVEQVLAGPPRLGEVRLVVVDGPAGSGKTTAADRLAQSFAAYGFPAEVVHMDDLYAGWSGLAEDVWDRLSRQVLEPLAAGRPGRYQVYDWHAGRFDRWVDVPVPGVLVVEGVGSAASPVDPWASLRLWVEAPDDLRLTRGIARDGEALREEWVRWADREAGHFAADGTRDRADLLVDGTAPPVA